MNGRHELKFYINQADYAQLKARLKAVMKPDGNSNDNGKYKIRSLYFDNYSDKAVIEKLSGLSRREKFRLRYYNSDISHINLERKSKANKLCYKEKTAVTKEQAEAILHGNYGVLNVPETPLLTELYAKIRSQNLRPKNIVEYEREAFIYKAGNVRVTFDTNIRTSNSVHNFLNPDLVTIPSSSAIILEIKYDGFLPDIIRSILGISQRNQTEFSKYVVSRLA